MIKSFFKTIIPSSVWQYARRILYFKKRDSIDNEYLGKSITNVFGDIYQNDEWGKGSEGKFKPDNSKFYSGSGSYNNAASGYVEFINLFIKKNNITSITDIGCGDFNIGKQIVMANPSLTYSGVDVVDSLIEHHNRLFSNDKVQFYFINTLVDPVPTADLLLVRQVLQHLSNKDIQSLIDNCFKGFKYVIVTEHQLKPDFLIKKNIDKETGPNIRLGFGSGVYLNAKPFGNNWKELFSVDDVDNTNCQMVSYIIID